jgi:hypothetical protein
MKSTIAALSSRLPEAIPVALLCSFVGSILQHHPVVGWDVCLL